LCYAIGGAPYQITGCAIGFFLQIYLLDVALVSTVAKCIKVAVAFLKPLFTLDKLLIKGALCKKFISNNHKMALIRH